MRIYVGLLFAISLVSCGRLPETPTDRAHGAIIKWLGDNSVGVQFRNEKVTEGAVCGEVYHRNKYPSEFITSAYYFTKYHVLEFGSNSPPEFSNYIRALDAHSELAAMGIGASCAFRKLHAKICHDPVTSELETTLRRCKLALGSEREVESLRTELKQQSNDGAISVEQGQ